MASRTFKHVLLACSLLACLLSAVAGGYHGYSSGDFLPGRTLIYNRRLKTSIITQKVPSSGRSILAIASGMSQFLFSQEGKPKDYIRTDGGFLSYWGADTNTKSLEDADLGAGILVMEPSTLRPPTYLNAPLLLAVLEGSARAGIITDSGEETRVRSFRRGDVIAVPPGYVIWVVNNNTQQKFSMVGGVRTPKPTPGKWESFPLLAGEVSGSGGILKGFSKDLLAEAFNVEETLVDQIQKSPPASGLLKLSTKELLAMERELDQREQESPHKNSGLIYNIDETDPDYKADAGQVTLLDTDRFPILQNMSLGAVKTHLKPGALVLPHFDRTSAMFGFITLGRARIQIPNPDGSTGADEELGPGDLFVVPRYFPLAQKSVGDVPLEWIGFTTGSPRMKPTFLAGKKSVYRAIPESVLAAATQLDKTTIEHWLENQPEECIAQREQLDLMDEIVEEVKIIIEEL